MSVADAAGGCPVAFAACLTVADAQALATQVGELRRWSADAWVRCGGAK